MAIDERQYQQTSWSQLEKALRWVLNHLNLRDWQIEFFSGEIPKEEDGEQIYAKFSSENPLVKKGSIIIDLKAHKKYNINLFCSIFHEVLHIFLLDCKIKNEDAEEAVICLLEQDLYTIFCLETKRKMAPYRNVQ